MPAKKCPDVQKALASAAGSARLLSRLIARISDLRPLGGCTANLTGLGRMITVAGLTLAAASSPVNAQSANDPDLWLTLHGDPNDPTTDLVEVRPEPTGLDQRVVLDLRVSRDRGRTSFRGQKYRSYYAKAVVNCSTRKAWYLWLSYFAEPSWSGQTVGREEYREGEAAVLFKDVPGQPYKRMISAACRVRG